MNWRTMSMIAALAVAADVCLAAQATGTNALAKAERRRRMREQRVAKDGGLVAKPSSGKAIWFADAQRRVGHEVLEEAAKSVGSVINMPVRVARRESAGAPFALAEAVLKEKDAGAAVLFVEDAGLPPIVIAPERSYAIVNAGALAHDFPPKAVMEMRARKELVRAAAWALGAGESMMKPCIMQYEPTLPALDANPLMVPSPDPVMRMVNGAMARGIETVRVETYRRACEEGWAPAPTNDVQKAIWDKVQAEKERGPTKPITIPPPKR